MTKFQQKDLLKVNNDLVTFIKEEVLPGLNISEQHFWTALSEITHELGSENRALLVKRDKIQAQIDQWNLMHQGQFDLSAYKTFLTEIGYLVPEGEDFKITTQNVDSEISTQAGPQLVVPTANARFALNAANARWGSLYDALYGTDVISDEGGALRGRSHNSIRANKVIAYGRDFLNEHFPLIKATHHDASAYSINNNKLLVTLNDGTTTQLQNSQQLIG